MTALFLNAGTPGPSIVALVSRVLSNGWRDVIPFIGAMWIGEVLWLSMAMAGLTTLAHTFKLGMEIIKWLGIGYLCWLALKMWNQSVGLGNDELPQRASPLSMFGAGLALTMGNPKIIVFYLALLPSLVDLSLVDFGVWAIFASVTFITLATIDLSWTFLAQKARTFLHSPGARCVTNRVGALALVGAAFIIASKS
ncbi:LysE family translocator [Vibrio mimicus]